MEPKKPKPEDIECRTFTVQELRVSQKGDRPFIEGHAALFNQYSEDLGGFVEIIEPGFFDNVLEDDVRSLLNHDPNYVLGRTTSGTLEIKQDDEGLFQRTYPPVTEPEAARWAQDLMVTIKRGDVNQQSFRFSVKSTWVGDEEDGDEWYTMGNQVIRRLKKGGAKRLYDVSPVTYPAYPQTDVSVNTRSRFQQFQESLEAAGQEPVADPEPEAEPERQEPFDILRRQLELKSKD